MEVERGADGVGSKDGGGGHVRAGEESVDRVGFDSERVCGELRDGQEVAAEAAGEVGDGRAEGSEACGSATGDERVGHHLEALGGVEEAEVGGEAVAGTGTERELLGQGGGFARGESFAEAGREADGVERRKFGRERFEGFAGAR